MIVTVDWIKKDMVTGESFVLFKEDDILRKCSSPILSNGTIVNYDEKSGQLTATEKTEEKNSEILNFYHAIGESFSPIIFEKIIKEVSMPWTKFQEDPFYLLHLYGEDETEWKACSVRIISAHLKTFTEEIQLNEIAELIEEYLKNREAKGNTYATLTAIKSYIRDAYFQIQRHCNEIDQKIMAVLNNLNGTFYGRFYFRNLGNDLLSTISRYDTYLFELSIAQIIQKAKTTRSKLIIHNVPKFEWLSNEQQSVIQKILSSTHPMHVVTGGPGTGKTTTIRSIVMAIKNAQPDATIAVVAPTGKASRKAAEILRDLDITVISTAQKLIGFGSKNKEKSFETVRSLDYILIDESSMLTPSTFEELATLIDITSVKMILIGDVDQLPSIEAGALLRDLINMDIPTHRLTKNFRSDDVIVKNANKILCGDSNLEINENFVLKELPFKKDCMAKQINTGLVLSSLPHTINNDEVIISPYRSEKMSGSTTAINRAMAIYSGMRRSFSSMFFIGAPVIMLVTRYKKGYVNGDQGVIIGYDANMDEYIIRIRELEVTVSRAIANEEMALSYAITIHKSQGSEYFTVHIVIPEYNDFVTRRMFYTAVTRAKSKIVIYSTSEILTKVINNDIDSKRETLVKALCYELLDNVA